MTSQTCGRLKDYCLVALLLTSCSDGAVIEVSGSGNSLDVYAVDSSDEGARPIGQSPVVEFAADDFSAVRVWGDTSSTADKARSWTAWFVLRSDAIDRLKSSAMAAAPGDRQKKLAAIVDNRLVGKFCQCGLERGFLVVDISSRESLRRDLQTIGVSPEFVSDYSSGSTESFFPNSDNLRSLSRRELLDYAKFLTNLDPPAVDAAERVLKEYERRQP